MPVKLSFDLARSAVLSMDYQTTIVPIYAQDQDDLLARAVSVLKRARNVGMRIIHVQVGFRRNLPEISPRNPLLSAIKTRKDIGGCSRVLLAQFIPQWLLKGTMSLSSSTGSALSSVRILT